MRCEMKLTVATVQLLVQSAPLPCVCGHVRHSPKGRLELLMPLSVATACEDTARRALREAALQVSPCTHTRAVHPYLWLLAHTHTHSGNSPRGAMPAVHGVRPTQR